MLTFELIQLFAGADWSFTESLADYPSTDYNLDIIIKKGTAAAVTLVGAADGTDFNFEKPAAETALLGFGDFNYQAVVTKISDSTVKIIAAGIKQLQPLLTASGDTRTFWHIQYENAKEIYDFLNNNPAMEVNFKGKLLKYVDRNIALEAMNIAKQNMEAELLAQQGKVSKPKIYKAVFS